MKQVTACLSPNGQTYSESSAPATRLLVATIEGVATLTRKSSSEPWTHAGTTLNDFHIGSLVHDTASGRLFAGAHENGGVWVSEDGTGRSWRAINKGLSRKHVYALAARSINGNVTLLAGTQPVGLYRSDDLGESWQELKSILAVPDMDKWTFPGPPHIAHVKCLAFHPTEPRTFFVMVEQGGLFRTTDDGQTFRELTSYSTPGELAYRDLHRLLINPNKSTEMYIATGEGVYRSEDAGEHWSHLIKRGHRVSYPDDLFFDPFDFNTLYMAGADKSPFFWFKSGQADPAVMKSTDRGENWTELTNGFEKPIGVAFEAMCQHVWKGSDGRPAGFMLAVASAAGSVWTSEDRGVTWDKAQAALSPVAKDHHFLPFLAPPERDKWMARRIARTTDA